MFNLACLLGYILPLFRVKLVAAADHRLIQTCKSCLPQTIYGNNVIMFPTAAHFDTTNMAIKQINVCFEPNLENGYIDLKELTLHVSI